MFTKGSTTRQKSSRKCCKTFVCLFCGHQTLTLNNPWISESCIEIKLSYIFSHFFVVPQRFYEGLKGIFSSSGIGTGGVKGLSLELCQEFLVDHFQNRFIPTDEISTDEEQILLNKGRFKTYFKKP